MDGNIEMKWYRCDGRVASEREMKRRYGEYVAKGYVDPSRETYEAWITKWLRSCTTTIPKESLKTFRVYGTAVMKTVFGMEAPDAEAAKVEAEFYLNNNEGCFDYETSYWEAEVE